jgi:hypothetical protein
MLITGPEQAGSVSRDCGSRLAGEARMSEATAGVRLQAGSYGGAGPRARRRTIAADPCRSRLAGEARMSEATAGVRLQAGSYAHGSVPATSLEAMYT